MVHACLCVEKYFTLEMNEVGENAVQGDGCVCREECPLSSLLLVG